MAKYSHFEVRKGRFWDEATVQSLICTLKDETAYVRFAAASAFGNQSTVSEAAIQSLIGALNDETADVRSSAASALGKQTTLSEAAIQSLIGALKEEIEHVWRGAASVLGNQSTLSETAIQSLTNVLKDENANARIIAASVLGTQSRLSETSIQSLFGARKDENARRYIAQIFAKHRHSLCLALASLSESEIRLAYKNHIFRYSCQHVMSLQVQDNRLCMYTEQGGLVRAKPLDVEKAAIIALAFETVQQNAWKRLDAQGHELLAPFVVQ
ncbi:unnamed protein product [Mortierella alpina]